MSTSLLSDLFRDRVGSLDDPRITSVLLQSIYEAIDSPLSLSCSLLLKYEEFDQLATKSIDPNIYIDAYRFRSDYLAVSIASKADFLQTSFNKTEIAYQSFIKSEALCSQTNERFRNLYRYPLEVDASIHSILHMSRRKVDKILGAVPMPADLNFGFGPGATTSCGGDKTSAYEKVRSDLDITTNCLPLFPLLRNYPSWMASQASNRFPSGNLVDGSKLLFVPKSAKTDRAICVEPTVNAFFQRGVGDYIRRRLARSGCNLNDQSTNQLLARKGSIDGSLSTLDLSAASDSISYLLVQELLPEPWFVLLDAMRSPATVYNSASIKLEKFSSMGNGYTFELESLLFLAIVRSTVEYMGCDEALVSVYGDDIICPTECFDKVCSVLEFCGFSSNKSKSFSSGLFRESCGAHWFRGLDVKPIFVRERIKNVRQVYQTANNLRRIGYRWNSGFGCHRPFRRPWTLLVNLLLSRNLPVFRGPEGFGDGHIVSNWDEACPISKKKYNRQLQQTLYYYRSCVAMPRHYVARHSEALFCSALYRAGPCGSATYGDIFYRRRVRYKIASLSVSRWLDLGPWL